MQTRFVQGMMHQFGTEVNAMPRCTFMPVSCACHFEVHALQVTSPAAVHGVGTLVVSCGMVITCSCTYNENDGSLHRTHDGIRQTSADACVLIHDRLAATMQSSGSASSKKLIQQVLFPVKTFLLIMPSFTTHCGTLEDLHNQLHLANLTQELQKTFKQPSMCP